MESFSSELPRSQPRLRARVEIINCELKIYPIADSDFDEHRIIDGLRLFQEARAS